MKKHLKAVVLCVGLFLPLVSGYTCAAQKSKPTPPAPIPTQILKAKKVFIANGGGDESLFDMPQYNGGPDRLYNEFYAAMKAWGRYELVSNPQEADLVFEIRLTTFQPTDLGPGNLRYDLQFQFIIRDVATHEILWGLTEHAQTAILQGNRDKNFEQALSAILSELHKIASPAEPSPNPGTKSPG